ncbi:MAG: FkbM family methyltransferase [Sulfitobacter sp.]
MNAQIPLTPPRTYVGQDQAASALRAAFSGADKPTRHKLAAILPPGEIEFAGVRMYVDPRDNYTERRIWLDGQPPEMESLRALVDLVEGRNALVLDVGANCGAFAVPLGMAVGAGSRVIAFEPNPVMIGRLGHNIALNGLGDVIRIEGCALGDTAGEAMLNLKHGNYGQASLLPIRPRQRAGGTLVPVRPLLDFAHVAIGHDLCVLKIDVEGAEEAVLNPVLDGGGWLPDALLMETRHADEWGSDLLGKVRACGFETALEADGNTLFVHKNKSRE